MSSGPVFGQGVGAAATQWQDALSQGEGLKPSGVLERFKALFSPPAVTVGQFVNAQESFKSYFGDQAAQLAGTIPESARDAFLGRADSIMRDIVKDSLGIAHEEALARGDNTVSGKALNKALSSANRLAGHAMQQLDALARMASVGPGDLRPQLVERQGGGFTLIRSAPQIENLVLRGGGAKGIGNPAALVEMEMVGMLSGLKQVVGTSAGALTATCLACGMNAEQFKGLSESIDMGQMKEGIDGFARKYPEVGTAFIGHNAGFALETLDRESAFGVAAFLQGKLDDHGQPVDADFAQRFGRLGPDEQNRMRGLRDQDFDADRTAQMVTFNDLRLLHTLVPDTFKELVLTGWDNTNKQETYFAAATHPDMPVAVAGRISMSIPVFFAAVQYDPGDGLGARSWTDGGVGSNMPSEVVTDGLQGRELEEARARTMLMTFDEGGKAYTVMHGKPGDQSGPGWLTSTFAGNPGYAHSTLADKEKLHNAGPNAFVIFHGDIGTLDLKASPERVREAKASATLKALEQIEARQNQAYALEVGSIEEAVALMTDEEQQAILAGGAPNPSAYARGASDPGFYADAMVYSLLESAQA